MANHPPSTKKEPLRRPSDIRAGINTPRGGLPKVVTTRLRCSFQTATEKDPPNLPANFLRDSELSAELLAETTATIESQDENSYLTAFDFPRVFLPPCVRVCFAPTPSAWDIRARSTPTERWPSRTQARQSSASGVPHLIIAKFSLVLSLEPTKFADGTEGGAPGQLCGSDSAVHVGTGQSAVHQHQEKRRAQVGGADGRAGVGVPTPPR